MSRFSARLTAGPIVFGGPVGPGSTGYCVPLPDTNPIATDAELALPPKIFRVSISADRTLDNPTNAVCGQELRWCIVNSSSSSVTVTLGNKFRNGKTHSLHGGLKIIDDETSSPNLQLVMAGKSQAYLTAVYDHSLDKFDVIALAYDYEMFKLPWAYWKLEEASGNRADASGNSRPLNQTDNEVPNATGKLGDAAYFPGNDGTLQNLSTQTVRPTLNVNWTACFWVKFHQVASGAVEAYFDLNGGTGQVTGNCGFAAGQTNAYIYLAAGSQSVATGNTLTPDVWHFVAFGHDGTQLYIEIDNSSVDTDVGANSASATPSGSVSWGGVYPNNKMTVTLDEYGIWVGANALTSAHRSQLYNSGSGWSPY